MPVRKFLNLKFFLLLIFFLPAITEVCSAQKILALDRGQPFKRFRFYVHDRVSVKMNDQDFFLTGEINEIGDTSVVIEGNPIPLSRIAVMKFDRYSGGGHFLKQASGMFPIAGVALLGVASVNSLIKPEGDFIPKNTIITAAVMIGSGPIAYRLSYHKIKINKRNILKVVDVSIK